MRTKDPCEGGKRNKTKKLKQTLEIDNIAICKLYFQYQPCFMISRKYLKHESQNLKVKQE